MSLSAAALGLASPRGGPWGRDLRTGAGPNAPLGLRHGRRRRAGGLKRIRADNFSDIVGRSSDQVRALKVHGTKSRGSARARPPAGDFGRPAYGLRIPSAAFGPRFGATRGGEPQPVRVPGAGHPGHPVIKLVLTKSNKPSSSTVPTSVLSKFEVVEPQTKVGQAWFGPRCFLHWKGQASICLAVGSSQIVCCWLYIEWV